MPITPNEDDRARGVHLGLRAEWTSGTIFDAVARVPLWRYRLGPRTGGIFLRRRDFVVYDKDEQEILRIRRIKFLTYEIVQAGRVTGKIIYRSFLRTSCRFEFPGVTWIFQQPLFTVRFQGSSDLGHRFWIEVGPRKNQWNLLVQRETDSVLLAAALAFMHHQYWRH